MSVLLPLDAVRKRFNPLESPPWGCEPISREEVLSALDSGRFTTIPHPKGQIVSSWSRSRHIERIAFLVETFWDEPIDIDVGVPALGCYVVWPITDGNHRLAAAIVRGDSSIAASVSGDMDLAAELFEACCDEREPLS